MSDVLDPACGLQQDDYSLSGVAFGDEGQLEVIGWGGKNSGNNKYYILKCKKCSQDTELFGEGVFRSFKGNLVRGQIPCGCSKSHRWNKGQYSTLCSRKAKELGYKFLGFTGGWRGVYTKIQILCEKHGKWETGTINSLVNAGDRCRGCRNDAIIKANTKPDDIMVDSFLSCGAFHPGTKFWRSERLNNRGSKAYWFMSCPQCNEVGESFVGDLQQGKQSCGCSNQRQQEAYINWIVDGDSKVAIKFGIARDSKRRVEQQNSKSAYLVIQYQVYKFPDVASCKKAERECKKELECGILLKRDMPDGWSETTWVYNLNKIEDIYRNYGGVLQTILDSNPNKVLEYSHHTDKQQQECISEEEQKKQKWRTEKLRTETST